MSEGGSSASGLQLIMEGEITDWWWGGVGGNLLYSEHQR